jgi:hypothetical protein
MYSPTGQNLWMEGGAVPATITAMEANHTVSSAALAAVPALPEAPAIASQTQADKAKNLVVADWASAVG